MFAGFGVSLRDLPNYLKWGSYVSYLRYGLEGYIYIHIYLYIYIHISIVRVCVRAHMYHTQHACIYVHLSSFPWCYAKNDAFVDFRYVSAIYGMDRGTLPCRDNNEAIYCHYRYPNKFLSDIAMNGDQFWNDIIALSVILLITRCCAYFLLKWKLLSLR